MTDTPKSLVGTQHGGQHYKGMAIQPAEFCHKNALRFCESEAIKYLSRFRNKHGALDVMKAIHFCEMILDMDYGINTTVAYTGPVPETKEPNASTRKADVVSDREDRSVP